MKPDNFEQKLQREPLRRVPAEWRAEILEACRELQDPNQGRTSHWLSTLNSQLSNLLWPHPKAWAGLAAVWIFIFIVNFSIRDKTPVVAMKTAPPSPEVVAQLKLQQRMLAELMGASQARDAEPPRFVPSPRSECVEILAV